MKTNFSGGEVRTGSAVWNTGPAMPVPEPREYTLRVELPNLAGWMEAKAATPEALIAFETGSLANAKKVLKSVRLCTMGESLGGVETLISHPASMTHASIGAAGRKKIGLTDGMVRISVGIEDVEDLIADLDQALAKV